MTVSVKPLLKLKKRASKKSTNPLNLGKVGEDRAARFLLSKGYTLLDRNVRIARDELDIVAWDNTTQELVFVEVKTRHQNYSGDPSQAIDRRKLTAIVRASRAYVFTRWKRPGHFRLDVITVLPGRLCHYENISWELFR